MKLKKIIVLLLLSATLALAGCEKDGPMENAGESIDNAVEEAGEAVEDAGDQIQDAAD